MPTVERITKASRIIVRYQGVGLSMLRNVNEYYRKNKYLRNNQGYSRIFVTLLNTNSVTEVPEHWQCKIPSKLARAYWLVDHLWKTSKISVETLWNE